MRILFLFFYFLVAISGLYAQNSENQLQNHRPLSPTAFEFLKYTEMPVSEYTGIASIAIPIHQINEDGISIPIQLNYHSGGIRVNQESSWVGLGWDLQIGSIIQEINDKDDYGINTIRKLPDWNESPVPSLYSQKYSNMLHGILAAGYNDPVPIVAPKTNYSYRIYSSYLVSVGAAGPNYMGGFAGQSNWYIPVNGQRDVQPMTTDLVDNPNYDSEPDIFSANFLGHSVKFIRHPTINKIEVLNNRGYMVTRTGDVYKIIVPSGAEFFFEQFSTVTSNSVTQGGIGVAISSATTPEITSKIWMLTKIITVNKREIILNYSETGSVAFYPSYSEKYSLASSPVASSLFYSAEGFVNFPVNGIGKTYTYSSGTKFYLSAISTENEEVLFSTSDRNDLLGGKKLDAVTVTSKSSLTKTVQLNYSYFDASGINGTKFHPENYQLFGDRPDLRLKLLSVSDNSGAMYELTYCPTPLPSKNSLAMDFWGFYNGQITNSSLIPNPARLNLSQLCTAAPLTDNGNNNSANLLYTQAGILTEIKFPTGGKVKYEYELNTFDNYWVPDFASTSNTISNGNGLRIKSVILQEDASTISKKTIYEYVSGKALKDLKLCRQYNLNSLFLSITGSSHGQMSGYQILEFNASGYYSGNSLGSGNIVGYGQVTKKDVDLYNNSIGRVVTVYNNRPDKIANSAESSSQLSISLPCTKATTSVFGFSWSDYPENGTASNISIYDNQNKLLKSVVSSYQTFTSELFYGARFFGSASSYFTAGTTNAPWYETRRLLVGYYPIFDIQSLKSSETTTDYDNDNNSIITSQSWGYNSYNVLTAKTTTTSRSNNMITEFYTAPSYGNNLNGVDLLFNANRLTEIVATKRMMYTPTGAITVSEAFNEYNALGNKIVKIRSNTKDRPSYNSGTRTLNYDQFDIYGNPTQTSFSGQVSSTIWDDDGKVPIAQISNAVVSDVAFTSFEEDASGSWSIPSTFRNSSGMTGLKSYDLSNGAINKSGLNASGKYIVSYWSNTGAKTVNGAPAIAGRNASGWVYYEHHVHNPSLGTINVSGSGLIDELRLYPTNSFMSTQSYDSRFQISSQCDANSKISYYEYDGAGRLILIRDQDRFIVSMYCYNYAGQPENCSAGCLYTAATWQNTSSPLTCQQSSGQNTGYQLQEQKDVNPCSPTFNQMQYVVGSYNVLACPLPPVCSPSNCVGDDRKCYLGVCTIGQKFYTSATFFRGTWRCTYVWMWPDCSQSVEFTEVLPAAPPITGLPCI